MSFDIFGGEVNLAANDVRSLKGLSFYADWDDSMVRHFSSYTGKMYNAIVGPAMNGQGHQTSVVGIKVDWNNYVFFAEARVSKWEP